MRPDLASPTLEAIKQSQNVNAFGTFALLESPSLRASPPCPLGTHSVNTRVSSHTPSSTQFPDPLPCPLETLCLFDNPQLMELVVYSTDSIALALIGNLIGTYFSL